MNERGDILAWLAYCENSTCEKRFECYRYMCPDECRASIDISRRCSKVNGYEYIYEIGDRPVRDVKEEVKETTNI